jgi:hypothetical protein
MENTFEKKEENNSLIELTNQERDGNALLIQWNHESIFIQDSPFFKEKKKEYEEEFKQVDGTTRSSEHEPSQFPTCWLEEQGTGGIDRLHALSSNVQVLLSSSSYLSLKYIELGLKESESYPLFHHRFTLFKMEFEYLFNLEGGSHQQDTLNYLLKNGSFRDKEMVNLYLSKKE